MVYYIVDIEADGLLDEATVVHVLSYQKYEDAKLLESESFTDYDKIKEFFKEDKLIVGHNIIRYDIPLLKKLLNINFNGKVIDTLGISWYLYPYSRKFKHGLEAWGNRLGIEKPEIDDWKNNDISIYVHRCEEDVKINSKLFMSFINILLNMYGDMDKVMRIGSYVSFIMDCLKEQKLSGIPLNVELTKSHKKDLEEEIKSREDILSSYMPKVLVKEKPNKLIKKDGKLSVRALRWFEKLKELNLPNHTKAIYENGNPNSHTQLKNWLYELGWEPQTFKESKATGEKIAQVNLPFGAGLCPSIKELFSKYPYLKNIDQLGQLNHRLGILKGFLKYEKEGKIYATAHGITNTHRLKHSVPVVNLPKVGVYYGKEIRELLTIPNDEFTMVGCDVSSLEDSTKQHYLYFFDPEYVNEMRTEGFDPHLDIGVLAKMITEEESDFYKKIDKIRDKSTVPKNDMKKWKDIKKKRTVAKTTNFAATYGAQPQKISETAKIPIEDAEKLYNIYWERNWAIKEVEKNSKIINIEGTKWVWNPVSKFWIFLKKEKDVFSTLNQNTGNYVFNTWLKHTREMLNGIPILLQYHDEYMFIINKHIKNYEEMLNVPNKAMKIVNKELNLNVEITISTDIGKNYADVH